MLLRFSAMEETVLPHFKGGEGELRARMFHDGQARILHGVLAPGCTIGCHTHDVDCEVLYILSGTGKVLCDREEEPLGPGDCHYCPKGHSHSLINDSAGDLEFFAVVPRQ